MRGQQGCPGNLTLLTEVWGGSSGASGEDVGAPAWPAGVAESSLVVQGIQRPSAFMPHSRPLAHPLPVHSAPSLACQRPFCPENWAHFSLYWFQDILALSLKEGHAGPFHFQRAGSLFLSLPWAWGNRQHFHWGRRGNNKISKFHFNNYKKFIWEWLISVKKKKLLESESKRS